MTRSNWWLPKLVSRIRAFGRVSAYVTFLSVITFIVSIWQVRAQAAEKSLTLGRDLAKLGDLLTSTHELFLNNQSLFLTTAGTKQSVGEVLDRVEGMCSEHTTAWKELVAELPDGVAKKAIPKDSRLHLGILREQNGDDDGTVACLSNDDGGGLDALQGRFKNFLETGEISALGKLRYVYATRTDKGTHVITVWTDGRLNIREMFPTEGDAPGSDSSLLPRPRAATRMLTASADGAPYAARIYRGNLKPEVYFSEISEQMEKSGWSRIVAPQTDKDAVSSGLPEAYGFIRGDGIQLVVSTSTDKAGQTILTLLEMGRN